MSQVTSRPYTPADLAACLAVFDSNVPEYFDRSERDEFVAFLDALPGPYLVLEVGGEVVGCGGIALRDGGRVADLCWGMIHGEHQGRGLGRELARRRLELARGDSRVRIVSLRTSQHTEAFYEKLGFRTESVETDGFAPGMHKHEMTRAVEGRT